eukprot:TRINITY_DN11126_c0_g2_i1.p1 TRINITY_DN11126_c0_g2~~TRINITY_DN11126_c0_g2_i1.p1  ORF type:complete len:168 (+),score=35.60 TRINITY_DN11126_c0_g2_i1:276-779(+)
MSTTVRHIVVGVDGSSYGDAAIDWAVRNMIKQESDVLHLVYAVTPLDGYVDLDDMGMAYVPSVEDQEKSMELAAKIVEEAITRSLGESPQLTYQSHIVSGDSRVALAELGEKLHAEAVIVGCHGRSALGRAVLGSTSTWLSHHCKRPVVIVRREEDVNNASEPNKEA